MFDIMIIFLNQVMWNKKRLVKLYKYKVTTYFLRNCETKDSYSNSFSFISLLLSHIL